MAKIIWLASYPKSGNTWVRFIVANLICGNIESSDVVHRLVPDFHTGISWQHLMRNGGLLLKTHLKYFKEMPLREDTIGVVYILRNPLDVIVSALNYSELRSGQKNKEQCQAFITEFIENGGLNEWKRFRLRHVGRAREVLARERNAISPSDVTLRGPKGEPGQVHIPTMPLF
jgi:hypothetical protein